MQPSTSPSTEQSIRLTIIIAGALAASVPLYMFIAWMVTPTIAGSDGPGEDVQTLAVILAMMSLGTLFLAQILFAKGLSKAEIMPTPGQRLGGYRVAIIVAFAVRESVAIYGLILSFLSGDMRWCFGFGVVALASMLLGWPKRSAMERLAAEVPPIM